MNNLKGKSIMKRTCIFFAIIVYSFSVWAQHRQVAIANTQNGDIQVGVVQLWDNGPWFAEFNVGATNPSEIGGYFTWGGVVDRDYMTRAYNDHDIQGTEEDAATVCWGSNWMMPSSNEMQGLFDHCDYSWLNTEATDSVGIIFRGKNQYVNDSVFFILTGRFEHGQKIVQTDQLGQYWTSTPGETTCQDGPGHHCLYFRKGRGAMDPFIDKQGADAESVPVRAIYRGDSFFITSIPMDFKMLSNSTKHLINGQLLINTNGQTFDALGRELR